MASLQLKRAGLTCFQCGDVDRCDADGLSLVLRYANFFRFEFAVPAAISVPYIRHENPYLVDRVIINGCSWVTKSGVDLKCWKKSPVDSENVFFKYGDVLANSIFR
ncbi:MAG: hypothetical protein ACI8Z1_001686 [Candidatus Azotimanducaceae bacterium]